VYNCTSSQFNITRALRGIRPDASKTLQQFCLINMSENKSLKVDRKPCLLV
jgi:hypothetical protein